MQVAESSQAETWTPEEYEAWLCLWAAALQDFPDFLSYVSIAKAIPDAERFTMDADGGVIPYKRWKHLMLRARAWQSRRHEIVLKARQLGLSWLAAAYAAWTAIRQRESKILLISQTEDDSAELMAKVQFVIDHLRVPWWLKPDYAKRNTQECELIGGGHIKCTPSTPRGGRGFTATLIIVDEAAHHLHANENFTAYSPAALDGGQILVLSTANGTTGFFHDLYERSDSGDTEFTPVFIGALDRPDRDMAWYERARRTFKGLPAEFNQEYPLKPEDAWVQLTGLVFPQYGRHAVDTDPVPWSECLLRVIGADYGGGDPTALVCLGVYRDRSGLKRVHQYGEFYKRNGAPTVTELYNFCLGWYGWDEKSRTFLTPAYYVGDPIGEQIVNVTLSGMLPNVVIPATRSRFEGLATHAWFLDQDALDGAPLFTLNKAACPNSHREYASYRWATRTDPNDKTRYTTVTPHDHHGDAQDARRGGLNVIYAIEFGRSETGVAYREVTL